MNFGAGNIVHIDLDNTQNPIFAVDIPWGHNECAELPSEVGGSKLALRCVEEVPFVLVEMVSDQPNQFVYHIQTGEVFGKLVAWTECKMGDVGIGGKCQEKGLSVHQLGVFDSSSSQNSLFWYPPYIEWLGIVELGVRLSGV